MKVRVAPREPVEPATITGCAGGCAAQAAAQASATTRIRPCASTGPEAAT
jgi:hypothetical protein